MLRSLHLTGVGPAPELSLKLSPRMNLLTGDNGLGKSFVLDIAWWALTQTWAGSPAWPSKEGAASPEVVFKLATGAQRFTRYSFEKGVWPLPEDFAPQYLADPPALVLYARVDGSFSVWDSARNTSSYRPWGEMNLQVNFQELSSSWAYNFSPESLWNGLSDNGRALCEGLVRDWVAWQRQDSRAFIQLRRILKVLSPEQEELLPGEPLRVSLEDVRDHPTLRMPYGLVPLVFASAGMKRVLSLAYLLVWSWQEHLKAAELRRLAPASHVVFLIDEVESHLHPKWQRLILPAIMKVAEGLREDLEVQTFVTTHAPLVLASAEPFFDDRRDAFFIFDLQGREVKVSREAWRSRGDASSWLTSNVFDLGEARSVEAEQAIQRAMTAMREPDLSVEEKRRIHHELHGVLKDTDPFWGRWLVQARAAGIEP